MLLQLNVKMLILNDEQEVIYLTNAVNELIAYRYCVCSSILH